MQREFMVDVLNLYAWNLQLILAVINLKLVLMYTCVYMFYEWSTCVYICDLHI